jgi:hypothetical protein
VLGAFVAYFSFGAIMLATRLDKVGEAATLRETSDRLCRLDRLAGSGREGGAGAHRADGADRGRGRDDGMG